jgi:hypothetical protein
MAGFSKPGQEISSWRRSTNKSALEPRITRQSEQAERMKVGPICHAARHTNRNVKFNVVHAMGVVESARCCVRELELF